MTSAAGHSGSSGRPGLPKFDAAAFKEKLSGVAQKVPGKLIFRCDPASLAWIAPVGLMLLFFLVFFTWVGVDVAGVTLLSQSGLGVAIGSYSSPTTLDVPIGTDGIALIYFLTILVGFVVSAALLFLRFGPPETVPEKFKARKFHQHNPTVTLMRTTPEENAKLGQEIGRKVAAAKGPAAIMIPLKGVSAIDADGKSFGDPAARAALYDAIRASHGDLASMAPPVGRPADAARVGGGADVVPDVEQPDLAVGCVGRHVRLEGWAALVLAHNEQAYDVG